MPPSKTANTVVEALLTTLNARVELAVSAPHTVRREYGVEVPTVSVPPIVAFPLVCKVPAVVFSTPMPSPPVKYPLPVTERAVAGEVVPIPTLPFLSTMNAVDVADAVEVETTKTGMVPPETPAIDSLAQGVLVPMPTLPVSRLRVVFPLLLRMEFIDAVPSPLYI